MLCKGLFGCSGPAGWAGQSADLNQPSTSQATSCCCNLIWMNWIQIKLWRQWTIVGANSQTHSNTCPSTSNNINTYKLVATSSNTISLHLTQMCFQGYWNNTSLQQQYKAQLLAEPICGHYNSSLEFLRSNDNNSLQQCIPQLSITLLLGGLLEHLQNL